MATNEQQMALLYRPDKFDDWGTIRDSEGLPYAKVWVPIDTDEDECRRIGVDPCKERGEFIVRACNANDDLLAALTEAAEHHEDQARAWGGSDDDDCDPDNRDYHAERAKLFRAAIAKATESPAT